MTQSPHPRLLVVMGTRLGVVKKTPLSGFSNPRAGGIIAMGVEAGDAVIAVQLTDGQGEVFIGTRDGMAIRFEETDVRKPRGRGNPHLPARRDALKDGTVNVRVVHNTGCFVEEKAGLIESGEYERAASDAAATTCRS